MRKGSGKTLTNLSQYTQFYSMAKPRFELKPMLLPLHHLVSLSIWPQSGLAKQLESEPFLPGFSVTLQCLFQYSLNFNVT